MKKNLVKLTALLMALVMALALGACQLQEETAKDNLSGDAADDGADNDAVAVSIGDKYNITRGEIAEQYDSLVAMYSAYGMGTPTEDADIESMQDAVVDGLVSQKILLYQADLMGITLTDDEKNGVDADVEDQMAQYMEMFRSQAESEGATDVDTRAVEIFNETLTNEGFNMDMEGFRAYIKDSLTEAAITSRLEEQVKGTVTASEEEAKTYYDDLITTQKETYKETPEDYLGDEEAYEKNGGDPILSVPEGYIRVKSITISPVDAIGEDFSTLSTEMDALEAEYGELFLTDAAANAARLTAIRTEYAEKKVKSDALYETYIAPAREKANKALAALKEGASFDEVLKEYGEDDVYATYPIFVEKGLLMQKGVASSTWTEKMVKAVDVLKDGEYTDILQQDDVFYILQLVGAEPAGDRSYEDVADEMMVCAQSQKAETYWTEQQEAWGNDTSLVTYHEDVYRSVGK